MTADERKVIDLLAQTWNAFMALPMVGSNGMDDVNDFRYGIHTLQRQIMARPTRRSMHNQEVPADA